MPTFYKELYWSLIIAIMLINQVKGSNRNVFEGFHYIVWYFSTFAGFSNSNALFRGFEPI